MVEQNRRVAVILCAYTETRWEALGSAIASVQQQTLPPDDVILVIDHNPILYERARTTFTEVKVIENHEGRGLSGARNSGISMTTADILAFMDEDAQAEPTWLAHLVAIYDAPQVLGVGGAILPKWQSTRPVWFPAEFQWVVGCTYLGMPTRLASVRNLIGCNMSFRRSVFETVGGFRHGIGRVGTLPVGCEETELCIRARQAFPTREFYYQPSAEVRHLVPPERATWRYFMSRCYSEGISKALVTQWVGSEDGLSSEWSYTLYTLPIGVLRAFTEMVWGKWGGIGRAFAIIGGLLMATYGYLRGRVAQWGTKQKGTRVRHARLHP
jgi:GT2 family glycosyltransferase